MPYPTAHTHMLRKRDTGQGDHAKVHAVQRLQRVDDRGKDAKGARKGCMERVHAKGAWKGCLLSVGDRVKGAWKGCLLSVGDRAKGAWKGCLLRCNSTRRATLLDLHLTRSATLLDVQHS